MASTQAPVLRNDTRRQVAVKHSPLAQIPSITVPLAGLQEGTRGSAQHLTSHRGQELVVKELHCPSLRACISFIKEGEVGKWVSTSGLLGFS